MSNDTSTIVASERMQKAIICLFYFFQGIQQGFYYFVLPSYLIQHQGITNISVLLIAVNLPWSLKLVIAPFVDRFFSRKVWIVSSQIAIAVIFFLLSQVSLSLNALLLITAVNSLLFASQDIAQDAYSIEHNGGSLRVVSGIMEMFKPLGAIVGALTCGLILHWVNLSASFLFLALIYSIAILFNSFTLEEHRHSKKRLALLLRIAKKTLSRKENLKLFLVSFLLVLPMGLVHVVMLHHCLNTLGWDKWDFISKVGLWAPFGSLFGGLSAIILLRRFKRQTVLMFAGIAQGTLLTGLMIIDIESGFYIVCSFVFFYQLCNALLLASLMGIIFDHSSAVARATTITTTLSWINLCFLAGYFFSGFTLALTFQKNLAAALGLILIGLIYCRLRPFSLR